MAISKLTLTMGGLLLAIFTFVVHTACYCIDDIHLSGNVWIQCLYAQGKMMSDIPQDVSMRSKGRGSFDTKVYICRIYIRRYLIVG